MFSEVAFDFKGGRIKLDEEWKPVQASVSVSNPMARSRAVTDEVFETHAADNTGKLINPVLTFEQPQTTFPRRWRYVTCVRTNE